MELRFRKKAGCSQREVIMLDVAAVTKILEYVKDKGWRKATAVVIALALTIYVTGFVVGCVSEVFRR